MKLYVALAVLFVGICAIHQSDAWWGWGLGGLGYGGFYSPYWGMGMGWPYYRYYRDTMSKGDITGRVQCKYIKDRSILSCSGSSGVVECGAVANFTGLGKSTDFELYGVGNIWNVQEKQPVEFVRYNLYPRLLDNSAWWNSTVVVDGHNVVLGLYYSTTYNYYGYRVQDLSCYERFVNLFRTVDPVNYENVLVSGQNGVVSQNVSLFGEIYCDKSAVKQ